MLRKMKFKLPCFFPSISTSTSTRTVSDHATQPGTPNTGGFRVFSYNHLKIATDNFRSANKIGEGGFGSVYKGSLQDGTLVAVKVLSVELGSLRGEREFISEITALSEVKHENLVTLRGCCIDGANRLLVYEYMENNSVSHTFLGREEKRRDFNWEKRRKISLGVARGLTFLHEEAEAHIVHRDIKPSNVVLDKDFVPKLADFGLSKLFTNNASHVSTRVAGTLGYLAPEYAITGHLTRKSDVYSFGVLLLQIVSGHSVMEFDIDQGETYLVDQAWDLYKENKLGRLVDPTLEGEFPKEEAVRFLEVGLLCVQEKATLRLQMSEVEKMLLGNKVELINGISKPGRIPELSHFKIGHKNSSDGTKSSSSSGITTSL